MDKNEILKRVLEEEDYIRCPKCSNSLSKFITKNPKGVEDHVISRLLMIPEKEIDKVYTEAVEMLKKELQKDDSK